MRWACPVDNSLAFNLEAFYAEVNEGIVARFKERQRILVTAVPEITVQTDQSSYIETLLKLYLGLPETSSRGRAPLTSA